MWNRRCMEPPPECKIKVKLNDADIDTLTAAKAKLGKSKNKVREHLELLSEEHYVMKRIIYKCVNQMRRDKALASFRQVNNCMKRLEQLKLESLRKTLQEYVNVNLSRIQPEEYLPSRQLLQCSLVRLVSVAALLTQMARYCSHTYLNVKQYLGLGNLVQHYLVIMAGSARVWYVCRSLRQHICSWYQAMYPCMDVFAPTQVQWLPNTETLPENLSAWILQQFGEETLPELTGAVQLPGTESVVQDMNKGGDLSDNEDLGVPVQRSVIQNEASVAVEQATLRDGESRKKKKKVNTSIASVEDPDSKPNHEDSQANRIQKMKNILKIYLKSPKKINKFKKTLIENNRVTIGDEVIILSKVGKRKITKQIDVFSQAVSEHDADDSVEQVMFNKLRNCLARLLVKYDKGSKNGELNENTPGRIERKQNVVPDVNCELMDDNTSIPVQKLKQKKTKNKKLGLQANRTEKSKHQDKVYRDCSKTAKLKRKREKKKQNK